MQRGRKSLVSSLIQPLAAVAFVPERLRPPKGLDKPERAIWKYITGCMPSDWFPPESAPMLVDLCRHISLSDWLAEELTALKGSSLADGANLDRS